MINGSQPDILLTYTSKWGWMKLMSEHKFFPGFCFVKRVPPSKEKHWIFRVCWIICCSSTLTPWYISYPISVLFTFHPRKNVIQMKKKEQRIQSKYVVGFFWGQKKLLTKQLATLQKEDVYASWNVLAKRFKVCHTFGIQKPM